MRAYRGITFRANDATPQGYCTLLRDGLVVTAGVTAIVLQDYRPGDVAVISHDEFDALRAELAKYVTPCAAISAQEAAMSADGRIGSTSRVRLGAPP